MNLRHYNGKIYILYKLLLKSIVYQYIKRQ